MANNQKKLKAFVRYDGSGRVVASSLILRKNKPRVGRWYEIPEYLCCNGTTNTTTTQGGGVTPTAFIARIAGGASEACGDVYGNVQAVYSASSTLGIGSYLYYDAALTQPVGGLLWVRPLSGTTVYTVSTGLITTSEACASASTTTTTTTAAAPVYKAFTVNSIYSAAGSICSTPNVFDLTRYFTGAGNYPVAGDTIYFLSAGQYFPLSTGPGSYTKMSNNLAITSNEQGLVLDVFGCPPIIDFTPFSACDGSPGFNPVVRANNITGTSTGNVYFSFAPQLTEQLAIDDINRNTAFNNTSPLYGTGITGGWTVGQTYYVAGEDVINPANIAVKTVTITSCS